MLDRGFVLDIFTACCSSYRMLVRPMFLLVLTSEMISSIFAVYGGFIIEERHDKFYHHSIYAFLEFSQPLLCGVS